MFCGNCGKNNEDGSKFCKFCGAKIDEFQNKQSFTPYDGMPGQMNGAVPSNQAPSGQPVNPQFNQMPPQPNWNNNQMGGQYMNPPAGNQKKSGGLKVAIGALVAVVVLGVLGTIGMVVGKPKDDKNKSDETSVESTDTADTTDTAVEEPIGESDDTALNTVLASITEAETLKADFYTKYESTDQNTKEGLQSIMTELDTLNTELARIKSEADAVTGLDKKAKKAETEYFNIMCNSHQSFYEIYAFQCDYLDFYNEYVRVRPDIQDNEKFVDYYYRLDDWYQSTMEAYGNVTPPESVKYRWSKLGDVLRLNESVLDKLATAVNNQDWLRVYSSDFMAERYKASEQVWYDMSYDICEGEGTLAYMQSETATGLAAEFGDYIGMSQADREEYEFENICDGEMFVDFDPIQTIYPSLFNTYDSFLIVKSGCINGKRDIVVETEIEGFTQKYQESFTLDSSYKVLEIKPAALTGNLNLDTARDAQMTVNISDKNGDLIETKSFPVHLTTRNDVQWFSDEFGVCTRDNILCFLTPESKAVSELKRMSIDVLTDISGGGLNGIVGYQYDDIRATYLQAAALQIAMSDYGVRYNMDSFSSDGSHQHVLLPNQVLEQKSGLCIETSLVIASALQSAGFHVYIVMPPGHAQVAVEVDEDAGTYYLIETTALPNSWNDYSAYYRLLNDGKYDNANYWAPVIYMSSDDWGQVLSQGDTYLIDCNDGPLLGMTPFVN